MNAIDRSNARRVGDDEGECENEEFPVHRNGIVAAALAASLTLGSAAPALADGNAVLRNIAIVGGAAAALVLPNLNHKKRIKREEMREQSRRQASYRDWFSRKYGYAPNDEQMRDWYVKTYGVKPS